MMELEDAQSEQQPESAAKVFEAAGGYAPTIGIIGAVLGLIQVMKHLENIEEVGKGIAVAFVATVYGVAVANLFFLPAANKLKARIRQDVQVKELLLEGVCSIVEGMNPKLIRVKLEAFLQHKASKSKNKAGAEGSRCSGAGRGREAKPWPASPRHAEHENHERWLVSYADFITLLFAFFVVMFASSQTDKSQSQADFRSRRKGAEGRQIGQHAAQGRQNSGRHGGRQRPGQRADARSGRRAEGRQGSSRRPSGGAHAVVKTVDLAA